MVRALKDVEKGCMADKDEGICLNPLRIVLVDSCKTHTREETHLEFVQERAGKKLKEKDLM